MIGIVEFITARLDEDEAGALEAADRLSGQWFVGRKWNVYAVDDAQPQRFDESDDLVTYGDMKERSEHIARHDPARVLREVKAKRAILALHSPVWLVNQWVQDADGQRHQGDLVVCRSCEPRTGFMTDQWPCDTIKLLAAPDAEHPDYNPAWRVK